MTVQVIASVSRWGGTHSSTHAVSATRVGAIVIPQPNSATPSSSTLSTQGSGAIVTASATAPISSRRSTGARQCTEPYQSPAIRLPSAQTASTTPDICGTPCSAVNATVTTSALPSAAPSPAPIRLSSSSDSQGSGSGSEPVARRRPGGSVPRSSPSQKVPANPSAAAATSAAYGLTSVASTVTSTGPTMNTTSSPTASSAYAVCSERPRSSMWVQRARTNEPTCGRVPPASAATANRTQSGASARTATSSPSSAAVQISEPVSSSRAWPNRSTSRPCTGPVSAIATTDTPDTAPARPYEPVSREIRITMPRPIIEIGIRPRIPAPKNAAAPGRRMRST